MQSVITEADARQSPEASREDDEEEAREEKITTPETIEVTPAMVSAGREQMSGLWLEFVGYPRSEKLWGEVLREVFLAMWEARSRSGSGRS